MEVSDIHLLHAVQKLIHLSWMPLLRILVEFRHRLCSENSQAFHRQNRHHFAPKATRLHGKIGACRRV